MWENGNIKHSISKGAVYLADRKFQIATQSNSMLLLLQYCLQSQRCLKVIIVKGQLRNFLIHASFDLRILM